MADPVKNSPKKTSGAFRPFEGLQSLLDNRSVSLKPGPEKPDCRKREKPRPPRLSSSMELGDEDLFMSAMAGVTPALWKNSLETDPETGQVRYGDENDNGDEKMESEALSQLKNLVDHGRGFVVANTPEYIEGTGYHVNPRIARRLHRGDFSIQAHIDLHGMGVLEAGDKFETFMKESIYTGKHAVLIVHGRGLSSPVEPVLKNKVQEWLTCGTWRKWVIAFASARSCDGGAGATYVLLRRRPFTKRLRKQSGKPKWPR